MSSVSKKTYVKILNGVVVQRAVCHEFETAVSTLKPVANEQIFLLVDHSNLLKAVRERKSPKNNVE
jgi:hypothetical protein